jgi:hypothetical protein
MIGWRVVFLNKRFAAAAALLLSVGFAVAVAGATPVAAATPMCGNTSTSFTALPDLGSGAFQGEQGGLYPGGSNVPPAGYKSAGISAASLIVPRDGSGNPSAAGKIVLISIGMSNTNIEFGNFMNTELHGDSGLNPAVAFVNGAQSGMTATAWANPPSANNPWTNLAQKISAAGYTSSQVQVVWLKEADFTTSLPSFETYAHTLANELTQITATAAQKYPNLRQVFVTSRTYGGYSGIYPSTSTIGPNPEPWAYETGFADKWFVAQSVANPTQRPWVGWGPYFWTNGIKGRSDGLTWQCADTFDGTHPSQSGLNKLTPYLHSLFAGSAFTPWFGHSGTVSNPSPLPTARPSAVASPATTPVATAGPTAAASAPVGSSSPGATSTPGAGVGAGIQSTVADIDSLPPATRYSLVAAILIVFGGLAVLAGILLGRRRSRVGRITPGQPSAAGTDGVGPHGAGPAEEDEPPALVGTGGHTQHSSGQDGKPGQ